MNKQEFINLLQKPESITALDLKMLEDLASTFPFCQAAHILIAKGNYSYGSMHAEQKIKKAALYTANRKNLKHFIQLNNKSVDTNQSNAHVSVLNKNEIHGVQSETSFSFPILQHDNEITQYTSGTGLVSASIENTQFDKINSLIDKFIQEDPSIRQGKPSKASVDENPDLASNGIVKFKTPVSETFANLLIKQGKIEKAIEVYDNLILKYPEKKIYFAGRIEELKKQL